MITFDACKELYPSSLNPISADRAENRLSFESKIRIEKGVAELPHGQLRLADGMP